MHIDLIRSSSKSLPQQISETLAQRITSGLLQPGARLPSVRGLAASLKVSQVTVSKAYDDLESRGHIICSQGQGCFVARRPHLGQQSGTEWQDGYDDFLPRAQLWRNFDFSGVKYPFHLAAIHAELLPLDFIGKTMSRLVTDQPELMASYGNFQGDAELREVMHRHLHSRGVDVHSSDIMITSGSQQGIDLVARTFVGPGDTVYLEAPSYTGAIDVFAGRGAEMIFVPMDGEGMRVDVLTRLCDRHPPKVIYTNPAFQNPSGVTMSMTRRQRLLELARSYRCLIVEDDPFSDLYFRKPPPPPIKSMDTEGHVVYMKSFSKVIAPGCRIACVAAGGNILSRLIAAKSASDLGSPLLNQRAVLPFIARRYDAYAAQLRISLRSRMEKAVRLLRQYAPPGVTWNVPEGGLNLWLQLPAAEGIVKLRTQAEQAGVSFLPGDVCYSGEVASHHIRLCYSQMTEDDMEQGLRLFLQLLTEHLRADPKA
ncbi:MocR-like pyridoxine biosynthesis transcription factor PdxR [Paenibacillus sp. FSL R7-0331]|uniref:MocR-like pyridoxine biosynthesis transcription factor PdxR n=1 Tax=Paenibacillus sp. FSL R7-0331 TaxID=1536773 RepID=UPI0004F7AF49|nr:PLP-dependent aminotransferase family protein [Paenibacillus sp. FSL R7-0331]AIQ54218.1 GntR family transcriptional regulator [Paenibacillus sp. FSL R7-0331]